jgi:hypothetical protein
MKKWAQSDLDAECNFSGLPSEEIGTGCVYEYVRESRAFKAAIAVDSENRSDASQPRVVAPSIQSLSFNNIVSLITVLREAGFPKPRKNLFDKAHKELEIAMSGWREALKQRYPPLLVEEATPERDLEREHEELTAGRVSLPFWRLRFNNERSAAEPELLRHWGGSNREYFFGFIQIDRGYNESEAVKAFRHASRKRWPRTRGGGGTDWRARLNQLAVMRIRKHERDPCNAACFVGACADLGMCRVFNSLRIQRSWSFARHRLALTLATYNLQRYSQSAEAGLDRLLPIA